MARAIPRLIVERLRDGLPADWTIIHGQRLATTPRGRSHVRESEIDLLVIAPGCGVACLEVKGGREVGRDERGWYSVDERGVRHAIKDPGRQAQESVHQHSPHLDLRANAVRGDDATVVGMDERLRGEDVMAQSWRRVRITSLASRIAEATGQSEDEVIISVLEAHLARISGPVTPAERAAHLRTYLETTLWPSLPARRLEAAAGVDDDGELFGEDPEGL